MLRAGGLIPFFSQIDRNERREDMGKNKADLLVLQPIVHFPEDLQINFLVHCIYRVTNRTTQVPITKEEK